MEKLIYKYDEKFNYWTVSEFVPYPKSEMILLQMSFNAQHYWITVEVQAEEVVIWDSFDEEDTLLENIPKLKMSRENYDQVLDEWNKNAIDPAKYLVFCRNNDGWVHLEAKDELSKEDLDAIEEDKQAKLKHEQRG